MSTAAPIANQFAPLSPNAMTVLEKRYLARDEAGKLTETADELFRRVAHNIAQADRLYGASADQVADTAERFHTLIRSLDFLPNSPTLANAGRPLQQLAACFVLPIDDSIQSIYDTLKYQAIIHQTGGGTGFSFSRIRPKGDIVKSSGGVASGPVSFMKVYNHSTEHIKQGGVRRGANMGILRVDHPDILEFITCKQDTKEITNFNISVAITDTFMRAYERDETYELINPKNGHVTGRLRARDVLHLIAECAWKTGEPGLFFIDEVNRQNPVPHYAAIEATNPCGEQPLLPFESCTLGSINLERHVTTHAQDPAVDWDKLDRTIATAVHFLDNVIDMNKYPIDQIERVTKDTRKIGLGIMGFSRMLFKLGIPYDSDEGLQFADRLMGHIRAKAEAASMALADLRGPYPAWEGSVHHRQGKRMRNSYVVTVAPTGTISMIADTSGGCEPEFSLIWFKNVMDGTHLPYVCDEFVAAAKAAGFWTDQLLQQIQDNHGSVRGLPTVPPRFQRIFVTAHDVSPEMHVRMQAVFQQHTDSGVSKTINLPSSATVDDVLEAYRLAYRLHCKGITVYRDGSREEQVLNIGTSPKLEPQPIPAESATSQIPLPLEPHRDLSKSLPDLMLELRQKVRTKEGNSFMHISVELPPAIQDQIIALIRLHGREREIFFSPSPHLKDRVLLDFGCRLASHMLRSGFRIEEVLEQLTKSYDQFGSMATTGYSLMKGMAQIATTLRNSAQVGIACPECSHRPLVVEAGCLRCANPNCGWSRC
jgi:ribonucleoside-diphosphate reductase alpha chain